MKSGLLGFLTLFCLACGSTQTSGSDAGPDGQQPDGMMMTGCPADPEIVTLDKGCLKGSSVDGVHTFLGVPFGAPPICAGSRPRMSRRGRAFATRPRTRRHARKSRRS